MQLLLHNKRRTQNQEINNTDLESTSQDLSNDMLNIVSAPIFAQNVLLWRLTLQVVVEVHGKEIDGAAQQRQRQSQ